MSKQQNTKPDAKPASKAGAAASPQDTAGKVIKGDYVVADGHAFLRKGVRVEAGEAITAADLKSSKDPDGTANFARQVRQGALVPARGKSKDAPEKDAAGGGVIDTGGATGAGPSSAQIAAAENGDTGAKAVVDAGLSGTEADFTAAADPDAAGTEKA